MNIRLLGFVCTLTLFATTAFAQLNGHNLRGDFGVNSGTQPPHEMGPYVAGMYVNYGIDSVRNRDGDRIGRGPQEDGDGITVRAFIPMLIWPTDKKLLGGNYAFFASPAFVNNSLEAPGFGIDIETGLDVGDLYLQPLNLGWKRERADFTAGVGLFLPIGKYEAGARDNTGLGMWSFELFGGATVYFDEAKTWSVATTAFWETHTEKKDSDQKVGDLLTLEGGFGKSFMQGAANLGVAYYAQWKLTDDDLGFDLPLSLNKHKVYGIGPEVTLPIPKGKDKLLALVTARYLFEFGAESTTEGDMFTLTATFPLGM